MFLVLFGWGRVTISDEGETLPARCGHCRNEAFWHLVGTRKWFSVFFIPVFSYAPTWSLLCPICGNGRVLENPDDIQTARNMVVLTAAFRNSDISEQKYARLVQAAGLL